MKNYSLASVLCLIFASLVVMGLGMYDDSEDLTASWFLAFGITAIATVLAVLPYWITQLQAKRTCLAIIAMGLSLLGIVMLGTLTESESGYFLVVVPFLCGALAIGYALHAKFSAAQGTDHPHAHSTAATQTGPTQPRSLRITLTVAASVPIVMYGLAQTISVWEPNVLAVIYTVLVFLAGVLAAVAVLAGWRLVGIPVGYALCALYGALLFITAVASPLSGMILAVIYLGAWYFGIAVLGFAVYPGPTSAPVSAALHNAPDKKAHRVST